MNKKNNKNNKKKKKKKKSTFLKVFFRSAMITGIAITTMLIMGILLFSSTDKRLEAKKDQLDVNDSSIKQEGTNSKKEENGINKTIAVFGVDKGESRTDTIMVININANSEKISLISIPRDTKVVWTDEQKDRAIELGRIYSNEGKITDMSSLGGIDNIRDFTICTIENILGIKIDNYVIVNTNIVKNVVDAIDGVEFNVPRRMEYTDKSQGLYIDLYPGIQNLNGEQAEGVLRWRHNNSFSEQYAKGDEGRIETQQLFIEAFLQKVFSPQILKNIVPLIKTFYEDVTTDISLTDALTYAPYTLKIKNYSLETHILPGESRKENNLWYYILDEIETENMMKSILNPSLN